jgi:hypothetical protein
VRWHFGVRGACVLAVAMEILNGVTDCSRILLLCCPNENLVQYGATAIRVCSTRAIPDTRWRELVPKPTLRRRLLMLSTVE